MLSDAILRSKESDRVLGFVVKDLSGVEAVVVSHTLHVTGCVLFPCNIKTLLPACFVLVAAVMAEVKSSNTLSVVLAGLLLLLAVLLHALFRGLENNLLHAQASLRLRALRKVNRRVVSLLTEAQTPA